MTTLNLSQFELELLQFILENRNTVGFFHCEISNIARNNTSRQISVFIIRNNKLINLDKLITKVTVFKLRQNGVFTTTYGMDAVFDLLYRFMKELTKILGYNEDVSSFFAPNYYELL